jgi:AraC family transcriptional regulator
MKHLTGLTVHDHLANAAVPLQASATFGHGLAGALWDRDETAAARYESPNHHTLSLYVSGGVAFRRRLRGGYVSSFGAGSLCLMPEGATSDWEVSGPVRMLHLYISRTAFQRAVVETIGADPAHVTLRETPYFLD